jgi:hypothetical protein
MPRIAEIKTVGQDLWVRLERPTTLSAVIYIWTEEELKAHDESLRAAILEELNVPQSVPGQTSLSTTVGKVPDRGD